MVCPHLYVVRKLTSRACHRLNICIRCRRRLLIAVHLTVLLAGHLRSGGRHPPRWMIEKAIAIVDVVTISHVYVRRRQLSLLKASMMTVYAAHVDAIRLVV